FDHQAGADGDGDDEFRGDGGACEQRGAGAWSHDDSGGAGFRRLRGARAGAAVGADQGVRLMTAKGEQNAYTAGVVGRAHSTGGLFAASWIGSYVLGSPSNPGGERKFILCFGPIVKLLR